MSRHIAQQTIDLHRDPSEHLRNFRILAGVDGPPLTVFLLRGIKWILPLGLGLLIGYFYLAAFFGQREPFEASVLIFLGWSVFAGLLESTSLLYAIPVPLSVDIALV